MDGYTPIAAYLGNEGWCVALELRPGSQHSALETHDFLAPVRHPAKRRRLKTVLQEIMYRAAPFIRTARQRILDFGRTCPVVAVFAAVQDDLLTAGRSP